MEVETSLSIPLEMSNENVLDKIIEAQPDTPNNDGCVLSESVHDKRNSPDLTTNDSNNSEFLDGIEPESSYSNNVLEKNIHLIENPGQSENTSDKENSTPDMEDDIVQTTNKFKKKNHLRIVDSDSDEENMQLDSSIQNVDEILPLEANVKIKERKLKRLNVVDSDSDIEQEGEITPHNKSFSENSTNRHEDVIFTSNSKGELVPEHSVDGSAATTQKSRLSALCDPDSEEDEKHYEPHIENLDEKIKAKSYKKQPRSKKSKEEKPKKMTGKEAAKLRLEIKAESQRMVRERNICLPYHRPKSYTLKEFLARRPKVATVVPHDPRTPPSLSMKMTTEQLAIITRRLEEREEELKQFYRSESESENEDGDEDYVPPEEDNEPDEHEEIENSTSAVNLETHILDDFNNESRSEINTGVTNEFEDKNNKEKEVENLILTIDSESHNCNASSSGIDAQVTNELNDDNKKEDKSLPDFEANNAVTNETDQQLSDESNLKISSSETDKFKEFVEENKEAAKDMETDMLCEEAASLKNGTNEITLSSEMARDGSNITEENNISVITETAKESESCPMDYEFNLDDIEENSERLAPEKGVGNGISEKQSRGFEFTDLDREIENFGINSDEGKEKNAESSTIPEKLSKLELIKQKLANIKPRLSGSPDDVIDLEAGITKPKEVSKLMERFARHTSKKHTLKNKVKLSIVSIESGEIHKETVAMNVEEDDFSVIEEKPGVKLQRLRHELQNQMAQKRSELWQQKLAKNQQEKDPFEGEKEECEADDDILDDEDEEAEFTELEDEEEEEEIKEYAPKEKPKSAFIDEEAEETDQENDEALEDEGEDIEGDNEDSDESDDENVPNEEVNLSNGAEEQSVKKVLKRIVKGFTEDSDDDDDFGSSLQNSGNKIEAEINENPNTGIGRKKDDVLEDDDDFLPPHQPQHSQTPVKKLAQTESKSEFEFLTPISYMTGLQNLNNSASKSKYTPIASFQAANEPSPLKENNWQSSLQKKLFSDTEITDSQLNEICSDQFPDSQACKEGNADEEELANMCSGKFPSTLEAKDMEDKSRESQSELRISEEPPSTQDLLDICSGGFTGVTQSESANKTEVKGSTDIYQFGSNREVKCLDEDQDLIISQLIDDEEMENFRRKFDSPLLSNTQKRIVEEFEEVVSSGRLIDSDDDEEEPLKVKKKKNQKKLAFSDDENSDDEEKDEEEVIKLHDDIDDEIDEDVDNIDYDSEENEIELTEEIPEAPRQRASEFFENEAELSESDWGSADEDEKDLDTMEFEQGDTEKFDEKKIRSDLERIHMRRLLDDDTREVKLLQELLLEDGELHGTGRERQFRWRNIDAIDDNAEERKEEDDVFIDEEESEEQYRKKRYEREMFLKEKLRKSQSVDDDLLGESQLLKIGQKVMQRSQGHSQGSTPSEKPKTDPDSPVAKQPFSLLTKRGSFLKRDDQVLQRLAEYSKSTTVILGAAKNSKNFLFQAVSEETSVSVIQDKKRKATDGTPNAIKKLRLSSNLSPAVSRKKSDKPESAKAKLFGMW